MEQVTIWIFSDNKNGKKLEKPIKNLGLSVNLINGYGIKGVNIHDDELNIFIFDLEKIKPVSLIKRIEKEAKITGLLKFMILGKRDINEILKVSYNVLHLEFISKPVNMREFLLLLEKTIISEKYKDVLKLTSEDAIARIEAFEGLMDINRKNVFESETEKKAFEKIIHYEKGLFREQFRLNKAVRDFSRLRQASLYELKKRVALEESLDRWKENELLYARDVINAQESLIDFSAKQLEETKEILNASENVAELSRTEAIELHESLRREKELNKTLSEELEKLLLEVRSLQRNYKK